MKRRDVIKNLGLSLGAITLTPTMIGLLQSCSSDDSAWQPAFFSKEEGELLEKIVDVFLPPTKDLPGAIELNIPKFIDKYIFEVIDPEEHPFFKKGVTSAIKLVLNENNEDEIAGVKKEGVESFIAKILQENSANHETLMTQVNDYFENAEIGKETVLDDKVLSYAYLDTIRSLAIFGFKNTSAIAKIGMAYYPVPGSQKGCIDLQEATGGKAYSL